MNNVIRKHYSKIMKSPAPSTTKTCNCRRKADYPMDGKCLSECLIYKASVSTTTNIYYHGFCENIFKERYGKYKCSFRNKSREKNTELSKYVWELKKRSRRICGFVDLESVTYAFVRSSLLQEQILMFCSVNVMSLSQNAGIEINLF